MSKGKRPYTNLYIGQKRQPYPEDFFFHDVKDYEKLDPQEFWNKCLFRPNPPRDYFSLTSFGLVGKMEMGKSNMIRFLVWVLEQIYQDQIQVIAADNLTVALDHISHHRFQLVIIEDAVKRGQDARQSMSKANVEATQQLFDIRHRCEEVARETRTPVQVAEWGEEGGVVYVIMGYQTMKAVDVRFRDTFDFIFFKSYYTDPNVAKILHHDQDALDYLKEMNFQSSFYHQAEIRGRTVGLASWGDLLYLEIPEVSPSEVTITKVSSSGQKARLKDELMSFLISEQLLNQKGVDQDTLTGLMMMHLGDNYEKYQFSSREFKEVVRRAKAQVFLHPPEDPEQLRADEERARERAEVFEAIVSYLVDEGILEANLDKDTVYGLIENEVGAERCARLGISTSDFTSLIRRAKVANYLGRDLKAVSEKEALCEDLIHYLIKNRYVNPDPFEEGGPDKDTIYGLFIARLGENYKKFRFTTSEFAEVFRKAKARVFMKNRDPDMAQRVQQYEREKDEWLGKLVLYLVENPGLLRADQDTVYGVLTEQLGDAHSQYKFTARDYKKILRRAKARMFLAPTGDSTAADDPEQNLVGQDTLFQIIYYREMHKMPYRDIAPKVGTSKSTAQRMYEEFRASLNPSAGPTPAP